MNFPFFQFRNLVLGLMTLSMTATAWPAPAAATARSQHTEVELISEATAVVPGVPFTVALRMTMDPKWHTYWKNPGDSGLATTITWTLPEGFSAGPIQWPAPQRIEVGGLVSYAHEGEIHLLTEITPPPTLAPGRTAYLEARIDWLECEDICIPGEARLKLSLPVSRTPRPSANPVFERARSLVPSPLPHPVSVSDRGDHFVMRITGLNPGPHQEAWFFPEDEQGVVYGGAQTQPAAPSPDTLLLRIPKDEAARTPHLSGVVRWNSPDGSHTFALPPTPIIAPSAGSDSDTAVRPSLSVFLFGFLGGLILNLMPCVFPVLGIKIMGLLQQSGQSRSRTARHGLVYTAGVWVSFMILAGVLLALREGGAQLGWGFQLQSPGFVFLLCALLLVFGLNMSGVFEVGTSLIAAGNTPASSAPRYSGSFFSGVLATVVATPCAAPFLAPALGAALTLPVASALLLFTAIALGLAVPFLILALFPGLVRFLPRPGAWMESFKQGLSFLLYAAAGYLLWVLVGQISESAQLAAILGLVALSAAAWIYGRWSTPARPPTTRRLALGGALLLTLGGLALGWPRPVTSDEGSPVWEPWSAERVESARAEGRPVYIDFTARWCATCQVNKKVVFGSEEVLRTFRERRVVTLKADWTNRDPAITAELARWGRSAVPFNLLYLPGRDAPVILPEILTPGLVLGALGSATEK